MAYWQDELNYAVMMHITQKLSDADLLSSSDLKKIKRKLLSTYHPIIASLFADAAIID